MVLDLLRAVNDRARNGIHYDLDNNDSIGNSEKSLRTQANDTFAAINELGGIG
jgi:hypothetical protein